MLVLINADNHGQPLGSVTLEQVRGFHADGVRTDIEPDHAADQLREFVDHPDLQLLALVHGRFMPGRRGELVAEARHAARIAFENLGMDALPRPPIFELGNEPTVSSAIRRWPPAEFGRAVAEGARAIWEIGGPEVLVVSGGVHNLDRERVAYLEAAAPHFPEPWEGRFAVGFHNYAPGMGDPDTPPKGFRTAAEPIARLKALGYPLFDTESGGHTGGEEKHTPAQVAAWLVRRLELSRSWGLLGTVVFQLKDGPDPRQFEHTFGLLSHGDEEPKPSGAALAAWLRERREREGRRERS